LPLHDEDMVTSHAQTPPLRFDPNDYIHHLTDLDLTDTQKHDMLETLFQIVVNFVDLGFGIHPIQQACGQAPENSTDLTISEQNPLYWSHGILTEEFGNGHAPGDTDSSKGGDE